jgi:hypothetical protein
MMKGNELEQLDFGATECQLLTESMEETRENGQGSRNKGAKRRKSGVVLGAV